MYLEGSDQHRGWFQSSLLVALATRGRPPFREVLTHGFLIDLEGRKMSKSIGNVISPQDVIKESGAEILRLWVATSDYSEELRVSKEILTRVVDTYRKLRNTCRILVANLYDFDPVVDMVPIDELDAVDRYALARYAEAAARILRRLRRLRLPHGLPGAQHAGDGGPERVLRRCDEGPDVHARCAFVRASLDADGDVLIMSDGLARLLAPILPVTADDLWRHLPGARSASVHLEDFPDVARYSDTGLMATWERLMKVREEVNAALEAEAQGEGHRQLARGAGDPHGDGTGRTTARGAARAPADALHRLRRGAARRIR